MNSLHLRTFIWLRWRLLIRQLQRGGIANSIVLGILAVLLLVGVLGFSILSFVFGLFVVEQVPEEDKLPAVIMYVWDVMVVSFLITWGAGLIAELQRAESLSMEKFLHLPVSLSGVFVLNYVSSLASLTMAIFLPIMAGFSLGVCVSIGPVMLLVVPLLAAFLLMVTGLSYQFQGWLAALMVNKRRRRSVIVLATLIFVVLCQLPQLVHFIRPMGGARQVKLDPEEQKERDNQLFDEVKHTAVIINMVLPPGWLPLGAMAAAEGSAWPALLGTLGMGAIGLASLRRAYRTTVRLYTGHFTGGGPHLQPKPAASQAKPVKGSAAAAGNMLERKLPWLSEQTAVIALAGLRSLLRAPEAKMLLLTPVFMLVVFGVMIFRGAQGFPDQLRPLLPFAAIGMSLFCLIGFSGNQFAFDRGGFKLFVLSPAPRRTILLGKNLSVAPLAVVLSILPVVALQIMLPVDFEHFLAVPFYFVSMYLLFCMLANWLSLLGPMPIAAGTMKPTNVKLVPVLMQILCIVVLPVALSPALLPLGIEYWLRGRGWDGWPICLLSSLIVTPAIVLIYWLVLTWQGRVLQARELTILQTITTKAE